MARGTGNFLKIDKPVFGDTGHIRKLMDAQRYERELLDGNVDLYHASITILARVGVYFRCAECGNPDVFLEHMTYEVSDPEQTISHLIEDTVARCEKCFTRYQIVEGEIIMIDNIQHPEKVKEEEDD